MNLTTIKEYIEWLLDFPKIYYSRLKCYKRYYLLFDELIIDTPKSLVGEGYNKTLFELIGKYGSEHMYSKYEIKRFIKNYIKYLRKEDFVKEFTIGSLKCLEILAFNVDVEEWLKKYISRNKFKEYATYLNYRKENI